MKKAAGTVISCLEEKNMSQRQLAVSMGEDSRYLNQQLHRQKDMKVERFTDVLDHIGYRVEIVDNDGIRKVCDKYARKIIETGEPKGLFWSFTGGVYTAIDSTKSEVFCEDFQSKEECFKWFRCERCTDSGGHEHFDDEAEQAAGRTKNLKKYQ